MPSRFIKLQDDFEGVDFPASLTVQRHITHLHYYHHDMAPLIESSGAIWSSLPRIANITLHTDTRLNIRDLLPFMRTFPPSLIGMEIHCDGSMTTVAGADIAVILRAACATSLQELVLDWDVEADIPTEHPGHLAEASFPSVDAALHARETPILLSVRARNTFGFVSPITLIVSWARYWTSGLAPEVVQVSIPYVGRDGGLIMNDIIADLGDAGMDWRCSGG